MDHLKHNDFLEQEQENLPLYSLHTAFKIVPLLNISDDAVNPKSEDYEDVEKIIQDSILNATEISIKEVKIIYIRRYQDTIYKEIFGYVKLEDESMANLFETKLNEDLYNDKFGDLTLKRGIAVNMKGVEKDSVIHLSLQFWNEPWQYGMENERTEIRRNMTDTMLHLIQPRFKTIFGEHYFRTVIADFQKTPDSMVIHAYILLDPDKDNLYHSYTVWFSPEGHVKFGRWILFPSNINVENALVVPNRYWHFLSDRSYMAPLAFKNSNQIITTTIPAFFIGSLAIIIFIGAFSFCHWMSYGRFSMAKNVA